MSADEALGNVYLAFSAPSDDFYGVDRPGATTSSVTVWSARLPCCLLLLRRNCRGIVSHD